MTNDNLDIKNRIVETAIELAEKSSWEAVRLNDVAKSLDTGLDEIRKHFREKEDIIDAWFDRADSLMLQTAELAEFEHLDTRKKLHMLMMNWLAALYSHRRVTRQMIMGKLEFGHIHYQVQGLLRISRTVQWWRDAAGISSTLPRRAIDETVLTSLYLATFIRWMYDNSSNYQSTNNFLKKRLDRLTELKKFYSKSDTEKYTASVRPQASS